MFNSRLETGAGLTCPRATARRAGFLLGASVAASLLAAPAMAIELVEYERANVVSSSPGQIKVESDGQSYTQVEFPTTSLSADINVEISGGFSGKVKSWETWLIANPAFGSTKQFKQYAYSVEYKFSKRPKKVDRTETVTIPHGVVSSFATASCNSLADLLRSQSVSEAEIFGQDRVVKVGLTAGLDADLSGIDGINSPNSVQPKNLDIVCLKHEAPSSINVVNIHVEEKKGLNGSCKLKLGGVIGTATAHQDVQFHYEYKDGRKSGKHSTTSNQYKSASFNHFVDLPKPGKNVGQVRIVIDGEDKTSSWGSYNITCEKPNQDEFAAEAPKSPDAPIQLTNLIAAKGLHFAGSNRPWGSQTVLIEDGVADAIGVGPGGKRCRFQKVGFQPVNDGYAHSGPFKVRIYRSGIKMGWKQVDVATFDLQAQTGLPGDGYHWFDLDLPEGKSQIKVVLDTSKQVPENDENNTYIVDVNLLFNCDKTVGKSPVTTLGQAEGPDHSGAPMKGKRLRKFKLAK